MSDMETENEIQKGTGQGLVEFLSYTTHRGLMNKNTAGAMRAAANEVLRAENQDLSAVDVRQLDVDDLVRRWANLQAGGKFKPDSIGVYQNRFRKAVEMYLAYLEDPAKWRPDIRRRRASGERRPSGSGGNGNGLEAPGAVEPTPSVQMPQPSPGLIQYPFPVRDGVIATLALPADLRKTEAKRLAAFLDSLAVDEPKALPPGNLEGGAD